MFAKLLTLACASCTLCGAAAGDAQVGLVLIQVHADAAAVAAGPDPRGCIAPTEPIEEKDLHRMYPSERIDDLMRTGGLERWPHPDFPEKMQYRVHDWAKQWKSESTILDMLEQDTMTKMIRSRMLLTRENPDCPKKTQYKIEQSFFDEALFTQVFDQGILEDLVRSDIVEKRTNTDGHVQYRVKDELAFARQIKPTHKATASTSPKHQETSMEAAKKTEPEPRDESMSRVTSEDVSAAKETKAGKKSVRAKAQANAAESSGEKSNADEANAEDEHQADAAADSGNMGAKSSGRGLAPLGFMLSAGIYATLATLAVV